jgi:hypothetical protein
LHAEWYASRIHAALQVFHKGIEVGVCQVQALVGVMHALALVLAWAACHDTKLTNEQALEAADIGIAEGRAYARVGEEIRRGRVNDFCDTVLLTQIAV